MRLRSLLQPVRACLAPYRPSFPCQQAQHFNVWCWVLVSLLSGLVGALYPAFRAAQQDPITALSYE